MEGSTKMTAKKLARYASPVSVSGNRHAFMMVGSAANPSASANRSIEMRGRSTIAHTPSATIAIAPQVRSKAESFQYALGLINDIENTMSGTRPDTITRTVAQISACNESAAPAPKRGTNAHKNQETLFGFDMPASVSRIYAKEPSKLMPTLAMTSQWLNGISNGIYFRLTKRHLKLTHSRWHFDLVVSVQNSSTSAC